MARNCSLKSTTELFCSWRWRLTQAKQPDMFRCGHAGIVENFSCWKL